MQLIAQMPELGHVGPKQAAALAGLAPFVEIKRTLAYLFDSGAAWIWVGAQIQRRTSRRSGL
jgi:hypothetical protein